jgi:UDP-N-acetyl-2-amino-2-deoxyglucuronate dehydrogenase
LDKLGLAVVGPSGVIGRKHVEEVAASPSARLVAIHDVNTQAAEAQAAELGTKSYETLDELLGDPQVDAITIATPHPFHMPVALKAFEAGKHVLSEKPIAATPSEADRMVKAARDAGLKLGVVFQNRFRSEAIRIREMVNDGTLGELYRTSLLFAGFRSQAYYDSAPWRGTWSGEGGGALFNQGIHQLDFFQWLGGMPNVVHGQAGTLMHDIEVEDSASALLGYANGAQGLIHCNTVQAPSQTRVELWGEKGGIVIADDKVSYYRLDVGLREFSSQKQNNAFAKPVVSEVPLGLEVSAADHADTIEDFARAVLDDREPAAPGEEGVKSLELAAAVIYSSCMGRPVELPLDRAAYDTLLDDLKQRRSLFTQNPSR